MDWKAAREKKELTLKQVADLSGYSIPTVNALELEGRGSDRLKEKLATIYGNRLEVDIEALHEGPDLRSEMELWKRRAKDAEQELHELRESLRRLTVNSKIRREADRIEGAAASKVLAKDQGLGE